MHGLDAQGPGSRLALGEAPLSRPDEPKLGCCFAPGRTAAQGFPGPLPRAAGLLTPLSPQPRDVSPGKSGSCRLRGRDPGDVDKPQGSGLTVLPALGPQQAHPAASRL